MKTLYVLLYFFFCLYRTVNAGVVEPKANDTVYCKIIEIIPYGGTYIIKAEDKDATYTIITENNQVSNLLCHHPIEEGGYYSLVIEKIDLYEEYRNRGIPPEKVILTHISGVIVYGISIPFERFSQPLYLTESLYGLCLLKDSYLPPIKRQKALSLD